MDRSEDIGKMMALARRQPLGRLADSLLLLEAKNVTAEIMAEDDGLIVLCDGIEAVLSSLPMDEYPQLPELPGQSGLADAETFTRSVQRVALAAGRDDTLPALLGIKVTSDHGSLELAATDRYRLAVDSLHWTGPDGADTLLPAVTLVAFAKRAAKRAAKTGKVALHFGEQHAGISDGTHTLITRTIQGEFPKFRSLIPAADAAKTTVLVVADALRSAVELAAEMLERGEPVHLNVAEDSITVQAWRDGTVASSQVVPAVAEGDAIEVRFCPAYLASLLAGVQGEALIGLASATKPTRITSADDDGFVGVCMPVRIQA